MMHNNNTNQKQNPHDSFSGPTKCNTVLRNLRAFKRLEERGAHGDTLRLNKFYQFQTPKISFPQLPLYSHKTTYNKRKITDIPK